MTTPITGAGSIRRAILILVVVGAPLIFVTGTFTDSFNVPKLALLIAGTSVASALKLFDMIMNRSRWRTGGLWIPVVSICGPLTISWALSPYRGWALFGQYPRFQGLLPYLIFGLFGLLVVDAFHDRPIVLAWALAGAGAISGAYALAQSLGLDPLTWYVGGAPFPVTASTGGHPNYTGGFLAISLPVAIYLWVRAPRLRSLGAAATVLISAGLLLSLSQGPWVAASGGVALVIGSLLASRVTKARSLALAAAGFMAIVIVTPVLAGLVIGEGSAGLFGGTSRSRATFWDASIDLAADSPVIGRGPNSFAVDGVRHRPLEDALRNGHNFTDDPHSVPLSFLANAGIFGLIGYIGAAAWAVGRYLKLPADHLLGHAFAGAAVAYFVQGLVGVDEPIQRIGMWVALAGLAACSVGQSPPRAPTSSAPSSAPSSTGTRMRWTASLALGALALGTVWWAWLFLEADGNIVQALDALQAGDVREAHDRFERAISFRDEFEFREIYAGTAGQAALNIGPEGGPLIEEMRRVNTYLREFPEHIAIAVAAEHLHYWGHFDPSADLDALAGFERLLILDPHNPLVEIEASEVLLDLDRAEEAVALLESIAPSLQGKSQDFWSMLAIAHFLTGDTESADSALDEADRVAGTTSCRNRIAHQLVDSLSAEHARSLPFVCSAGLVNWYEDHEARTTGSDGNRS